MNTTKTLIVITVLAAIVGCGESSRYQRSPSHAPVPPWMKNGGSEVNIVVPAGEVRNVPGDNAYTTLIIKRGARLAAPDLEIVTGRIEVEEGAKLAAPLLRSCEVLVLDEGATVAVPKLTRAAVVIIGDNATLVAPRMHRCGGVRLNESSVFEAPCEDYTRTIEASRGPAAPPDP